MGDGSPFVQCRGWNRGVPGRSRLRTHAVAGRGDADGHRAMVHPAGAGRMADRHRPVRRDGRIVAGAAGGRPACAAAQCGDRAGAAAGCRDRAGLGPLDPDRRAADQRAKGRSGGSDRARARGAARARAGQADRRDPRPAGPDTDQGAAERTGGDGRSGAGRRIAVPRQDPPDPAPACGGAGRL